MARDNKQDGGAARRAARRGPMLNSLLEKKYAALLRNAGVTLNGDAPCDLRVHDRRLYRRVLLRGSLGFGEAYMDGWWDCDRLDQFFEKLSRHMLTHPTPVVSVVEIASKLRSLAANLQRPARAFRIGKRHYDVGNALFERMLDSHMNYSCGYWKDAADLEAAQQAKMRLICEKLKLAPGMKVLDIGCGWGGLARYAASHYGVSVVGVTVSERQHRYAAGKCDGLPIDIRLCDYRALPPGEHYDRVYSVGMFEHVGYKNYDAYMRVVRRVLRDDGLCLLHTIGSLHSATSTDPWIARYIFPNSMLPSARQITTACENRLLIEDWHNFGADYAPTLMSWFENFDRHWDELKADYDERFYRMWKYYLLACAGFARARNNQLWQIVLSPFGIPGGYRGVR